nr:iron transporter [Halarchaeum solikamskense]
MLAQRMGFHYGDNVALPSGGTYDVTVHVGAPAARRTGALAAPESATFEFSLAYSAAEIDAISYRTIDRAGERGALDPMSMRMIPGGALPAVDALPGRRLGTGTIGDAAVAATLLDDATGFGGDESDVYLAVSPRTPYNDYPLPMAGFGARVDGTDHDLVETIDAALGHHYGVVLDGDVSRVTIGLDVPPQVSRHGGYETAFFDTASVTLGE